MPYKVLIADDNATVRRSIRSLLESAAACEVCGEAENGAAAVQKTQTLHPDLVILDLGMPILNGLEAARQISQMVPNISLVMFTMHANEHLAKVAGTVGIQQVVSKAAGAEDLITAVTKLLDQNRPPPKRENHRAQSFKCA